MTKHSFDLAISFREKVMPRGLLTKEFSLFQNEQFFTDIWKFAKRTKNNHCHCMTPTITFTQERIFPQIIQHFRFI